MGTRVGLHGIVFLDDRESVEKLGEMKGGLVDTCPFSVQAKQRNPTLVPSSQQRLHKSTVSAETGLSL